MLVEPSIEKIKSQANCPFEAAILVSQRARQLTEGAQPMVADKAANNVSLACREVVKGKVVAVPGTVDPEVPITREEKIRREEEKRKRERQLEEERSAKINDSLNIIEQESDLNDEAASEDEPSDEDTSDDE